jgi:hypothetical protein
MRKVMFVSLALVMEIALAACAQRTPTPPGKVQPTPSVATTSTPRASAPTPIPKVTKSPTTSGITPFALDPIREYLASQLNLPVEQITLISWQAVTWRDACLGVHLPKQGCAEVITPGFSFKFQTGSTNSNVNTDATGKNYRLAQKLETPGPLGALSWIRTGGFTGVCQILNVYSTGAYWLGDCNTLKVVAQGVLSQDQQAYLSGAFEQYGSFEWKPAPPAGSADMFNDQIKFFGAGSQTMTEDEQQQLNTILGKLAGELGNVK